MKAAWLWGGCVSGNLAVGSISSKLEVSVSPRTSGMYGGVAVERRCWSYLGVIVLLGSTSFKLYLSSDEATPDPANSQTKFVSWLGPRSLRQNSNTEFDF